MSNPQPQKHSFLRFIIFWIASKYLFGLLIFVVVIPIVFLIAFIFKVSLPTYEPHFEVEEIKSIRLVHLLDSNQLDRLGVYAIIDPEDYSIVLETLNYLEFRVDSSPKQNITNTTCFQVETLDGQSELLCNRGFLKVENGILSTGYFTSPENWSAFDQLWRACIEHRLEP